MPYNPGVQDMSGQLRAQGIRGASSTITQGFEEFGKRERERQSALGSIMGSIQGDPSMMEEINKNPDSDIGKIWSRAQSGRASNAEINQLNGLLSANKFEQKRKADATQAESERTRNAALNTMAIAQAAQIKGADEERQKNREQATARASVFANIFKDQKRDEAGNKIPVEVEDFVNAMGTAGVPLDDSTMSLFGVMANDRLGRSKLAQATTAAERRAQIAEDQLIARQNPPDRDVQLIEDLRKRKIYTDEQADQALRDLSTYNRTRPLGAGAEFVAALDQLDKNKTTPAGAGAGGVDPRVRNILPGGGVRPSRMSVGGGKPPPSRTGRLITVQNPASGATFQVDETRADEFLALGAKIL